MNKDEYHSLIQQLPDIIYKINEKGHFTFLNDSIATLGYTPQDLLGKHFSTIVHKDYIDLVSREKVLPKYRNKKIEENESPPLFDERRTEKRRTENLEIQLVHKQEKKKKGPVGSIFTIVNSEGLWKTDDKKSKRKFLGTIGIIRNITSMKIRDNKVKYLHTLIEVVKKIQNVCSQENNFLKIRQSLCEILIQSKLYMGVQVAVVDEKINRIIPLDYNNVSLHRKWSISPEGVGDAPLCIREVLASKHKGLSVWKGKTCEKCEYCGHKNGHKVITLKIPYQNKIIGILLILIESTKSVYEEEITLLEETASCVASVYSKIKADILLKAREQQYRHLVENLNEGIWVIDKVYNTTFINTKMATMLQYTREELIGKPILKFINRKDKRNFWIYLKQCIMGIRKQYDCRFNCKGGKQIFALIAGSVVVEEHGIYNGLILGIVNISKRKQIERSLVKKNKMLNRFNNIAVHRELKMIELKKEINTLLARLESESKNRV